jgi:hypothetical protein
MDTTPLLNPTTETGVGTRVVVVLSPSCKETQHRQQQEATHQEKANAQIREENKST